MAHSISLTMTFVKHLNGKLFEVLIGDISLASYTSETHTMRRFILSTLAMLIFVLAGTAQQAWPDLTTIKVGVNKTCTVDGAAARK